MNAKLRFSLYFSGFIGCVLVLFSFIIYGVIDQERRTAFSERSLAVISAVQKAAGNQPASDSGVLAAAAVEMITNCKVTALDAAGGQLYAYPAGDRYIPEGYLLNLVRARGQYDWQADDGNEYTGLLQQGGGVAVAGGYDGPGFTRLSALRSALVLLVVGGILIAVVCSLVFSRLFFLPFRKLARSMQEAFLRPGGERIPQPDLGDEAGEMAKVFNSMVDRVNQLTDFQKTFVFHASHEFRTPLATMLSETESALAKEMDTDGYRQVLSSLKEEQQDLIELTSSLLLLSLSDSHDFARAWTLVRIDEILYETISKASRFFPKLQVDMHFASVPDNPDDFLIRGEESLLRSAFLNILKNGYMYGVDQKVSVLIEFVADTILVHFDNRGTQLPADEKANIMEPFFRGGNALKTKGYGLGLSVVNRVVMVMKGRFQYTPVANDINRFTITLKKAV